MKKRSARARRPKGDDRRAEPPPLPPPPPKTAATTSRVVWGSEPIEAPDIPWVDAATAAAFLVMRERSAPASAKTGDAVGIFVVANRAIEEHRFPFDARPARLAEVRRARADVEAFPDGPRIEDLRRMLARPGADGLVRPRIVLLGTESTREWIKDLKKTDELDALTKEQLSARFEAALLADGGAIERGARLDYRLGYPLARWGTSVPFRETIRGASSNFRRAFRIAGDLAGRTISFALEQGAPGEGRPRASFAEARIAGPGTAPRELCLDACPATGASRFVLRGAGGVPGTGTGPRSVVWPISRARPVEPPRLDDRRGLPAAISVCLAVDRRSAGRAWAEAAPLVEGIRRAGRLARLQVAWSGDGERTTRGWATPALDSADLAGLIRAFAEDHPDRTPCRGLSQALREALLLDGKAEGSGRAAVAVVVVDRDYEAGPDRGFRDAPARWAWVVRLRRSIGAPPALLAYRLDEAGGGGESEIGAILAHLVVLGRQAGTARQPVARLRPGSLDDPEVAQVELEAVLAIADRMGPDGPTRPVAPVAYERIGTGPGHPPDPGSGPIEERGAP